MIRKHILVLTIEMQVYNHLGNVIIDARHVMEKPWMSVILAKKTTFYMALLAFVIVQMVPMRMLLYRMHLIPPVSHVIIDVKFVLVRRI